SWVRPEMAAPAGPAATPERCSAVAESAAVAPAMVETVARAATPGCCSPTPVPAGSAGSAGPPAVGPAGLVAMPAGWAAAGPAEPVESASTATRAPAQPVVPAASCWAWAAPAGRVVRPSWPQVALEDPVGLAATRC
ncbi:hypothetical protein NJB1907f44_23820, partial [Mycobacterium marinum]